MIDNTPCHTNTLRLSMTSLPRKSMENALHAA